MKHIKEFESLDDNDPVVGDYVICNEADSDKDITAFISSNIGQIIKIKISDNLNKFLYFINYDNIPYNLRFRFTDFENTNKKMRGMFIEEIKYWSKNKEDLEVKLQANKYNL